GRGIAILGTIALQSATRSPRPSGFLEISENPSRPTWSQPNIEPPSDGSVTHFPCNDQRREVEGAGPITNCVFNRRNHKGPEAPHCSAYLALRHRHASVDMKGLPRHVSTGIACKIKCRSRYILRLSKSLRGNHLSDF